MYHNFINLQPDQDKRLVEMDVFFITDFIFQFNMKSHIKYIDIDSIFIFT